MRRTPSWPATKNGLIYRWRSGGREWGPRRAAETDNTYHDTGIIRGPGNECDLVAGTLAGSEVVLEVVDGVARTLADGTLVASSG